MTSRRDVSGRRRGDIWRSARNHRSRQSPCWHQPSQRPSVDSRAWEARRSLYTAYWNHTARDGSKTLSAREFYNRVEQINGIRGAVRKGSRGFAGVRVLDGNRADAPQGAAQGAGADDA
jgi:hypothetical protein